MALTYLALIDSDLCTATLEDALQLFVQGLYETQRDGNLSEDGFDNSDKIDKVICPAGTFNKLLEKVNGVHPDVELTFINRSVASHKLPVVVCEEVDKYLQERSSPYVFLIESLKIEGVEVIWSEIESKINKRLFDEFGVLFKGENDPDFKMFIDAGKYTPIDDLLSSYEKDLVHPSSSSQTVRASFFTPKDKDQKVERRTENSNSMATENNITLN
ncbi:hypothetical protein [Rickettsiella massiliensis]|uniref:hypothetical protein n=1 Tax=Rickettsiella massiliensis TaxID=676517 RepID=UPI00029A2E2F|nr:hypothetical protein [Rickettsiella massiliensis]